ncbi:MAG TPA: hypothetical protein VF812_04470 [Ktedonobacterales bacterium]
MGHQARRYILMVVALSVLSVALVACQATAVTGSGNSGGPSFTLTTPGAGSPTPTFPEFTIGAWPSNYSPGNPDTITIYAICRKQDTTMMTAPQPPNPGVTVTFLIGSPINQTATGTTGSDGIATAQVAFSDPNPGTPVIVTVTTSYNGQTYTNTTFFTPGATFTPTPSVNPNTTPGATPGTTATP